MQPSKSFLDGASGSLTFDWFAFNGDGDPKTKDDQIRVQGELSGGLEFEFSLSFDWDLVKVRPKPPFIDTELPELKVGLEAAANSKASLEMEGAAAKTFKREDVIWSTPLSPIPIGPLVFLPVVDLVSEIYGGASSSLHVKMGGSFNTGIKVAYSTKSGGEAETKSPKVSSDPTAADIRGRAEAGVSIGPRLHLRLYGAAGPYADLAAQAQVKGDIDASPCWQANAGLGGHVGIDIVAPIYGHDIKIANWNKEISLAKVDVAYASCVGADGSDPAVAAKAETPLFASFAYWIRDIWVNVPRFTTASFGPDGNFLLTGSTAKVLAKLPGKSASQPLWVRQFHYGGEYQDRYPYYQNSVYLPHGISHVVSTLNPFGLIAVNSEGKADWARVISKIKHKVRRRPTQRWGCEG